MIAPLSAVEARGTVVLQVTIALQIYGHYLSVLLGYVWLECLPKFIVTSRRPK